MSNTIEMLMDDFMRETIHGPSGSYVPVGDRPHQEYLDLGCIYKEKSEKIDSESIKEYI